MKIELCDICRKPLTIQNKRHLSGAFSVLYGAETICAGCMEALQKGQPPRKDGKNDA